MMRKYWTKDDIEKLMSIYSNTSTKLVANELNRTVKQIYMKAASLGLKKSAEYMTTPESGRFVDGNKGVKYRFKKGNIPHNAGVKGWNPGGNAKNTQFKQGNKPHTWIEIGSERITKEGYLQRKINDTGVKMNDWVLVHKQLWEEINGTVPDGHIVVFKNGDKTDIRIDNLELISREENMRRNSVHTLPKELALVIQLKGAVQRQINKRMRNEK